MVVCLPRRGASPLICAPRAARTCCDVSVERSRTQGKRRARMISWLTSFAKPVYYKDGQSTTDGLFSFKPADLVSALQLLS